MTSLEKKFAKMTPEQARKAMEAISDQMGMPQKKKKTTAKKTTKKKG